MKLREFELLCRNASMALGVDDLRALGLGLEMQFADVMFRASFSKERASFLLLAELGAACPSCRPTIYEHLLTTQIMTWDRSGLRFGFDPERQTVLLGAEIKVGPDVDGEWVAALVRCMAAQSLEWRETLLVGHKVSVQPDSPVPRGPHPQMSADRLADSVAARE
jgi:hypothetical protein